MHKDQAIITNTMTTELDAFTALLYDHKFDVDDIISALCGTDHYGRWLLNSRKGTLIRENTPAPAETKTIQDGDDGNHWHVILPLPQSFLVDIKKTAAFLRLTPEEQADVTQILDNIETPADLPQYFDQGFTGGWLRERVKDSALLWLDGRGMIPPSMKHVYHKHKTAHRKDTPKKVAIQ